MPAVTLGGQLAAHTVCQFDGDGMWPSFGDRLQEAAQFTMPGFEPWTKMLAWNLALGAVLWRAAMVGIPERSERS